MKVGGRRCGKTAEMKTLADEWARDHPGSRMAWATLKRGLYGVYHHASPKHLGRYVNEFTFRLNAGNCKIHTLHRLESFIAATARKRLTYARLVA